LKTAYRNELYRSGVTIVNKEHFTSLYSPARAKALTKKNTLAGWLSLGGFHSTQTEYSETSRSHEWYPQIVQPAKM
jgi:hypothetical protein